MSRFLPLIPLMLWFAWSADPRATNAVGLDVADGVAVYLLGFVALVGAMREWGRLVGRRGGRGASRFYRGLAAGRIAALAWHAAGLFALGWATAVTTGLSRLWPGLGPASPIVEVPGLVLGTLPVLLAWAGLRWAQYPADLAVRERVILARLDDGLPVHAAPPLGAYLAGTLRLSIGFTLAPVLAVLAIRDAAWLALWATATRPPAWAEAATTFGSAAVVFLLAPELLRRVLSTRPLPAGPLRERLEALCARTGLRYRDILLWRTGHAMGNAAVMGVVPPVRYVLLSDLLIESMTDRQIEAVFAHEVGHVRHGHMGWYVVFMIGLTLTLAGPADWLTRRAMDAAVASAPWASRSAIDWSAAGLAVAAGVLGFGALSRRFERQADVYAARTMGDDGDAAVGPDGADAFASALARVALINGVPLRPRRRWSDAAGGFRFGYWLDLLADKTGNYLHGSLWARMRYLQRMARDPANTRRFDRSQVAVRFLLVALVVGSSAWLLL